MNFGSDNQKQLLMGNEAIALGAIRAGVELAAGYPGTPSSEILETVAKRNDGSIYVEWSVNEKAAMEVAAGAAYCGARTLVTMKQVGLNVASDPLMSLAYVGVKGGMVIAVADDPGPISSQTEQDSRLFAQFAKLPVFDPVSPEEAYLMIADAFALSEQYGTPVLFRPTTRLCHGCADIQLLPPIRRPARDGFVKDSRRWVIFPRLAYANHQKIEARNQALQTELSDYPRNHITGSGACRRGVAAGGVSYAYVSEVMEDGPDCRLLRVATPHPFPEKLALEFLEGLDEVLCVEELDPVIERGLLCVAAKYHLPVTIRGKLTGDSKNAGENSVESVRNDISKFLNIENSPEIQTFLPPELPARPPVLCAGCPHRASFYAVKKACKGRKAFFCGDIGCYTLGNAMPLDMVDTCLCMGADVTMAQGMKRMEPDAACFSFIGDSTFFASGITGVVNAVYNQTDIILAVLDNSTTAMTGHQPHPGTGRTMMGDVAAGISIEAVLRAIGVSDIQTVDPLDGKAAVTAVKTALDQTGVRAIIFKSPCIAVTKPKGLLAVDSAKCVTCRRCITELGCPAIVQEGGKVEIEPSLCFGCGLCAQVCPTGAIEEVQK
jgi:indolepyruvate ferredoxin oxidoreductase alpha subunit